MPVSFEQPGTADPLDVEYRSWESGSDSVSIHMHLDAVDGIARDVIEGFKALPRRGAEVGGLLLGRVEPGERIAVWIERFQRIPCQYRLGPQFVLEESDSAAIEQAVASISEKELSVVGFYRSHTRPGFQIEESDLDLARRYFNDPSDLILLIRPENMVDLSAQFFRHEASGSLAPVESMFPFRGRGIGPMGGLMVDESEPEPPPPLPPQALPPRMPDPVPPPAPVNVAPRHPSPPRERVRRLVPDFRPAQPPRPASEFFVQPPPALPPGLILPKGPPESSLPEWPPREPLRGSRSGGSLRKWWPLLIAVLLVSGTVWLLLQPGRREALTNAIAPAAAESSGGPVRPLGLYVDPSGPTWRISWNPGASALRAARSVQLFVRDGDDQNRVELTPQDLGSGTWQYPPKGHDVTIRLEVTDGAGRISAESFRVLSNTASNAPVAAPPPPAQPPKQADNEPAPAKVTTPARAAHKVPPVVSPGIRPRITRPTPVDVRVQIDARGRVIGATPTAKERSGLEAYLAERAVYAAKLWRFEPARDSGGRPVASSQIIHFVFEK